MYCVRRFPTWFSFQYTSECSVRGSVRADTAFPETMISQKKKPLQMEGLLAGPKRPWLGAYLHEAGSHLAGTVVPVAAPTVAMFSVGAVARPQRHTRSPLVDT
jgi:hypothetical protein